MGNSKDIKTCAIIGAGPAGLMAADHLSAHGIRVQVFDQMPSFGRKFLLAGRGGLNLTHSEPLPAFLAHYSNSAWLAPAIEAFPPDALRNMAADLGEPTFVGSSGRVFPKSFKASPFLRAFLRRIAANGVEFFPAHRLVGLAQDSLQIRNEAGKIINVRPHATLLALGGASWPKLGSDGAWQTFLQPHNIAMAPLEAANCGYNVAWSPNFIARFAGHPLKTIAIQLGDKRLRGEIMISASGLEGGLIYALSADLREAFRHAREVVITLDLRPDVTKNQLAERLARPRGAMSAANFLRKSVGLTPLAIAILHETGFHPLPQEPQLLAALIKAAPIRLTGPADIVRAISSSGGVRASACSAKFMLNFMPGVFVAGEMLDWDAPTGGYLMQACFSTGYLAAQGVLEYLQ